MKSIPKNLINEKVYCVNYIIYLNSDGEKEYLYLAVRGSRMDAFMNALREGGFDAEEYGLVLEHGKGEADETLKSKMEYLYNCDHANPIELHDSASV